MEFPKINSRVLFENMEVKEKTVNQRLEKWQHLRKEKSGYKPFKTYETLSDFLDYVYM